ncbi:hypothetical protein N7486_006039 [Penicillium sp. IBT 16267x]|nr:hypothetical protein N7486_006039 [Penicillium sp. IBT 16267x]
MSKEEADALIDRKARFEIRDQKERREEALDDIIEAKISVLTQNEDDANGLTAPFTTGQYSVKTSGETDEINDNEGDSAGHFTNSFNDHKDIEKLPDKIKQLQKDIDCFHRHDTYDTSNFPKPLPKKNKNGSNANGSKTAKAH